MTEKIVRQGDKITPDLKELMEMLSEKVIKYAEGKDINTDSNGGGSGEER
jgi:hypothetical protein